jgi:hypothetical protein
MLAVLGLALPTLIAGCAAGSGARLDRSGQVLKDFLSGRVLEGYRYYTTGMHNNPDAILAIAPGYTLKTDRWREREMTPQALRQMVGEMNAMYNATTFGLLGSHVLNGKGERIGLWYSALGWTTVEMTGAKEVRVSPPSAPQLDKLQGGNRR